MCLLASCPTSHSRNVPRRALYAHTAHTRAPGSYKRASRLLQRKSDEGRRRVQREYTALFPRSFDSFARELSEGIACGVRRGGACPRATLERLFSWPNFLLMWTRLFARDWTLTVSGSSRTLLLPNVDMMNHGQMGLRISHDDAASELTHTHTYL